MLDHLAPNTLVVIHYHKWSEADKDYIAREIIDPLDECTCPSNVYVAIVPLWLCQERYLDYHYKVVSCELGECISPMNGEVQPAVIVHLKEQ